MPILVGVSQGDDLLRGAAAERIDKITIQLPSLAPMVIGCVAVRYLTGIRDKSAKPDSFPATNSILENRHGNKSNIK